MIIALGRVSILFLPKRVGDTFFLLAFFRTSHCEISRKPFFRGKIKIFSLQIFMADVMGMNLDKFEGTWFLC